MNTEPTENYLLNDGDSPVIIHAPHGGLFMPDLALEGMVITPDELQAELLAMTDSHTDILAVEMARNAAAFGRSGKLAGTIINRVSRLAVDPERFPDEREEMNTVGMAAVYTHGSRRQQIRVPDEEVTRQLLDTYFHPYAKAFEEVVTRKLETYGSAAILDVHSYPTHPLPYELHGDGSRPDICLGYDPAHCSAAQADTVAEIFRSAGFEVDYNSPFSGSYVPLRYYGEDRRVVSIMLEIRRDKYMDESTGNLNQKEYRKLMTPLWKTVDYLTEF